MESRRKIVLYIATSLDGYISREDGAIDWLFSDQDYGYQEFFASVDTLIIGRLTYEQSLTLAEEPFGDKRCYVFTHNARPAEKNSVYVQGDVKEFAQKLVQEAGKDIWLVGGAQIIDPFMRHDLIDEYILSIHPVLLGSGRPLFLKGFPETWLEYTGSTSFSSGLVQIRYVRRKP